MYQTKDYDFELPDNLIAQTPLERRDNSRLLVLNRENKKMEHRYFSDIVDYLNKDDVLVLNDSRVLPARLFGIKQDSEAAIEVLLLKEIDKDVWQCLCRPAKRIKIGTVVVFGDYDLELECVGIHDEGLRDFKLKYTGILVEILERLGTMPLPPYIKERLENQERYQTIYSKVLGSSAAPTAGLHFTEELLDKIREKGVKIAYVTLHVGLGTFRPVNVDDINKHKMHSEYYSIDEANAEIINAAIDDDKKIISVGTTSTRTLEAVASRFGRIKACFGETDIFIYPGYEFKIVNMQITNFHLPKSTLMMLISAFASKELVMNAYHEAIENEYRFFSFGDSMIIL